MGRGAADPGTSLPTFQWGQSQPTGQFFVRCMLSLLLSPEKIQSLKKVIILFSVDILQCRHGESFWRKMERVVGEAG